MYQIYCLNLNNLLINTQYKRTAYYFPLLTIEESVLQAYKAL
ncbi:hypothetical protein HMPREF1551_01102 [Capnocytophaga sp. oral taxon 863 str. F0517]|nr:hypothetical protein HMPREF1551_01102 [Capnocytophaga sp. oral taxon 863 str. F0517]